MLIEKLGEELLSGGFGGGVGGSPRPPFRATGNAPNRSNCACRRSPSGRACLLPDIQQTRTKSNFCKQNELVKRHQRSTILTHLHQFVWPKRIVLDMVAHQRRERTSPVFKSVRILMMATALLTVAAVPGHAQTDLTAAKQAVSECVAQVRRAATLRENYDQFGQPPMWRNFDAFVAPDGRVHENANFVGEQDGVYLFEKCLADRGFSLGFAASTNAPKPSDTCNQQELDFHPGDCWIKLSGWEKRLTFVSFEYGWLHSFGFAERQQYDNFGSSRIRFLLNFDVSKMITYFDSLYSTAEYRNITWDDAFDLLFRTQTNPATKDIPGLIALYRKHLKPLFSGSLQKFVPPNKVVISEFRGAFLPAGDRNETITLTLLGVSSDKDTNTAAEFMAALLNVKACNTLVRQTDKYKFFGYPKGEKERQQAKEAAERSFHPQLAVVIQYTVGL